MSTYYLAAAYVRRHEINRRAAELIWFVKNAAVTSRWHREHPQIDRTPAELSAALVSDRLEHDSFATNDIRDLQQAKTIIMFSGGGTTGGRHVEFGYALARGKRCVLIGKPENVFYTLQDVEWYEDWESFLRHESESGAHT